MTDKSALEDARWCSGQTVGSERPPNSRSGSVVMIHRVCVTDLRSPPFMMVITRHSSVLVWKAYASETMNLLWTRARIRFSTMAPCDDRTMLQSKCSLCYLQWKLHAFSLVLWHLDPTVYKAFFFLNTYIHNIIIHFKNLSILTQMFSVYMWPNPLVVLHALTHASFLFPNRCITEESRY